MQFQPVAAPADERTPEGQFQLRCRELIGEIRSLGFEPNVWVAMINDLGAAAAARKLLADHHQLGRPGSDARAGPDQRIALARATAESAANGTLIKDSAGTGQQLMPTTARGSGRPDRCCR